MKIPLEKYLPTYCNHELQNFENIGCSIKSIFWETAWPRGRDEKLVLGDKKPTGSCPTKVLQTSGQNTCLLVLWTLFCPKLDRVPPFPMTPSLIFSAGGLFSFFLKKVGHSSFNTQSKATVDNKRLSHFQQKWLHSFWDYLNHLKSCILWKIQYKFFQITKWCRL